MGKVDLWDTGVSAKEIAERLMSAQQPVDANSGDKKRRKRRKKDKIIPPVEETVVVEPVVQEKVETTEEIPPEKVERRLEDLLIPEEPMVIINPEGPYVVTAGIQKRTERQLFLSTWRDSDDWSVCYVPTTLTYERCEYMINKAIEDITEKAKKSKIKMEPTIPPFEIVLAKDLGLMWL